MALQFPMVVMVPRFAAQETQARDGRPDRNGDHQRRPGADAHFGWLGSGHGVAGAGLASLIAIIVGTVWLAYYFFDAASYLKLHPHFKPQGGNWGQVLKIGLPAGVEFALIAVYLFVVYTVSRPFGAAAQAGFGIGQRIIQADSCPSSRSVSPWRRWLDKTSARARRNACERPSARRADVCVHHGALSPRLPVADEALIGFFSSDPGVIAVGAEYLRVIAWARSRRDRLRERQHVSGDGKHHPSAHRLVHAHAGGRDRRSSSCLVCRDSSCAGYGISGRRDDFQVGVNLMLLRREFRLRLPF